MTVRAVAVVLALIGGFGIVLTMGAYVLAVALGSAVLGGLLTWAAVAFWEAVDGGAPAWVGIVALAAAWLGATAAAAVRS